jgi:hypothetical protein
MLLDNFPHLATAKRRARVKDALGGSKDSFTTLFTDRACWRQQASSREINTAQARDILISHKVFFASDPGLTTKDVLVIGGDTMSVRSYAHPDASAGLGVVWKVFVNLED